MGETASGIWQSISCRQTNIGGKRGDRGTYGKSMGMYQSGYQVLSHVVTVFTRQPVTSRTKNNSLWPGCADTDRSEAFIMAEYSSGKMGLEPFRLDMASEDVWEYDSNTNNLPSDEYAVVF